MGIVDLIIIFLASYRVSDLLSDTTQEGPFGILLGLRVWSGVYFDEYSNAQGSTSFARGLLCQYCNSIWIGLLFTIVAIVLSYFGIPIWYFFLPLAISGFVILIKEFE